MLQPIRTLQAPPLTSSSAKTHRKESTIGETLANFASSLMGGKHKNVTKEKEQNVTKEKEQKTTEVQPRSTKEGEISWLSFFLKIREFSAAVSRVILQDFTRR
mgnify:FL=1